MDQWIFPLTVLPGIGLLIMSTTNWAIALTGEINDLLHDPSCDADILRRKVEQLQLINLALVALYFCTALFALSGFFGVVSLINMHENQTLFALIISLGMLCLLFATGLLILYGFRAVGIKTTQFKNRIRS